MDAPFTKLFRQFIRERGLSEGSTFTIEDVLGWFQEKVIPGKRVKDIREQLWKHTTNCHHRVEFPRPADCSQDLFYSTDSPAFTEFELYQPEIHVAPLYKNSIIAESELRRHLAKHSEEIEEGLTLIGELYPAGSREIDLLYTDREGNWLVVELKVSRSYEPVVGQLLWYMGWIKKNKASANQMVRGVIIAPSISKDLQLAASMVPHVEWLQLELPAREHTLG